MDTNFIDVGEINYNDKLVVSFGFINSGNEPLIVARTFHDGGCFICIYSPREPIMPGQRGEVKFMYDTKRLGPIGKSGGFYTNASESPIFIKIKGIVIDTP